MSVHLRWPAFSSRNGEESEKRPQHIVVVELIFPPFPGLSRHFILIVIQEQPSNEHKDNDRKSK